MNVATRMTAAIGRPVARLAPVTVQDNALTVGVVAVGAALLLAGGLAYLINPAFGVAALGIPVLPIFVLYPAHALLAFVAAMPFDAVAALLPDRTLSLTRLLGIAVIGGWGVWVLVNRVRVRLTTAGILLGGYVAFATLSYFWADNPDAASDQLQTLIQLFLLYVLTANLMSQLPALERTLNVLILATALLGVLVIWQLPGGGADVDRGTFTYGDTSFNPNYLAAALVLPAVAAAALGRARGTLGWWRLAAIIPIGAGIIASGSRGGIVGFIAGVALLLVARPRLGMQALGGLVLLALAAPLVLPPTMLDHLWARFAEAGADRLSGRLDIWKVAVAMISDRPIRGTGFAGFRDAFYEYMSTAGVDPLWALQNFRGMRVAHNVYLSTFAELGLLGMALLMAAFAAHGLGVFRVWQAHRLYGDPRVATLALALCCMLVSFLVFAGSIDFMMRKTPWIMLGMIQGLILATTRPGQGTFRR
jgi:O-antigen ligase